MPQLIICAQSVGVLPGLNFLAASLHKIWGGLPQLACGHVPRRSYLGEAAVISSLEFVLNGEFMSGRVDLLYSLLVGLVEATRQPKKNIGFADSRSGVFGLLNKFFPTLNNAS